MNNVPMCQCGNVPMDVVRMHYEYSPRGRRWAVYRMKRKGDITMGEKVADFGTREEAKREAGRLNREMQK